MRWKCFISICRLKVIADFQSSKLSSFAKSTDTFGPEEVSKATLSLVSSSQNRSKASQNISPINATVQSRFLATLITSQHSQRVGQRTWSIRWFQGTQTYTAMLMTRKFFCGNMACINIRFVCQRINNLEFPPVMYSWLVQLSCEDSVVLLLLLLYCCCCFRFCIKTYSVHRSPSLGASISHKSSNSCKITPQIHKSTS